ncbi:hypothetical protein A3A21_01965 [Candidatus Jorgensenbacteria bacterium RIFCSPLOWO2_01_FULL_45_25b]|uniref:DUF4258 domain-containing protein n=1 Tax=Candidatus Jorgensenbacteria bacterium RIFCSPLOWO2_01_FULL_45_25b TaxID=1798471 RepID=A0A1F6BZC4_9BACT|nr:MAG: hypothetical protein A3A21_01965 [Candidatus Jorgensenbacteria bacterium RIFCSPLOWO2_01_FULL_45_25b]
MKIIFTHHAELKIRQRNIEKELVKTTLEDPDFVTESHANRKRAYKKFIKNYLEVIFVYEQGTIVVLTAHWVAKIKKTP